MHRERTVSEIQCEFADPMSVKNYSSVQKKFIGSVDVITNVPKQHRGHQGSYNCNSKNP